MSWLVNAIAWIVNFFASGKAKSFMLIPFKISVGAIAVFTVTSFIAAIISLATFLVDLFNTFHDLINSFNDISNNIGSGSAYGISLQSIWNVFLGFLSASGLSTAITTSFSLFLTLFFSYMTVKLALIVSNAANNISRKMYETIMMMGQS
ncbi:hypothetical protein [Nautilia lithotrophica]